VSLGTI
jgi:MFS family permease